MRRQVFAALHPDEGGEKVRLQSAVAEHRHRGQIGFRRHSRFRIQDVAVFLAVVQSADTAPHDALGTIS